MLGIVCTHSACRRYQLLLSNLLVRQAILPVAGLSRGLEGGKKPYIFIEK
jgi:hypothetical protein